MCKIGSATTECEPARRTEWTSEAAAATRYCAPVAVRAPTVQARASARRNGPARDNGHRVDAPVQGNAHRAGGTPGNGHQEDDVPLNGLRDVDAAADRPLQALAVAEPQACKALGGAGA